MGYRGAHESTGSSPERYQPRHREDNKNSAELLPAGSDLVERFHSGLTDPDVGQSPLGPDDMLQAIAVARTGIDDDIAIQLVGAADELNRSALHVGESELVPLLDELKVAVYGTSDVHPMVLYNRTEPGALKDPLHNESRIFRPTGMGMKLRVLYSAKSNDQLPNPNADIQLRVGKQNIWYVQVGQQKPFAMQTEVPLTLGRAPHGHDEDPYTLGTNTNTSRRHITLQAVPPDGIQVTDHSKLGTEYYVQGYPPPSEFKEMRAAEDAVAREDQIEASRNRLNDVFRDQ